MPAHLAILALLAPAMLLPCPDAVGGGGEPRAATPSAAVFRAEQAGAGVVLGDGINVRAGPGTAYDIVGKLGGGERVVVLGEAFGWLLVRPSAELKVFVSKDLLESKGRGVAAVRRDRVNLRSRPALDGTIVGQVSRGDVVRLLEGGVDAGPGDDFVAISAPPDVALYVHRDLVRLVDPESAEAGAAAGTVLAGMPPTTPEHPERDRPAGSVESKDGSALTAGAADGGPVRASPAPPKGPTAAEKALRARDLYLAQLDRTDLAAMDFRAAQALYEEALREAANEETRAVARSGLKRVRLATALQEDYRRRMSPIERMVEGEKEPCGGR